MKHNNLFNVSFIMSLVVVLLTVFALLPGMVNAQESSPEFVEFQSILTEEAFDWESFIIGNDSYLVVANAFDSKIYKWNGSSFVEFQSIPARGATDGEFFTIGSDSYLRG